MSSCFRRGGGGGATSANNNNRKHKQNRPNNNKNMTETQTKQPVKKQTSIGLKTCGCPETEGGGVVAVDEDCLSQTCVFVRCIFSSIYILNCNCLLYILIRVYFFIYIVYSSPAYFHPFIILKIYFSPIVHIAPSLLLLPPPPHRERDLALKARLQRKIINIFNIYFWNSSCSQRASAMENITRDGGSTTA